MYRRSSRYSRRGYRPSRTSRHRGSRSRSSSSRRSYTKKPQAIGYRL